MNKNTLNNYKEAKHMQFSLQKRNGAPKKKHSIENKVPAATGQANKNIRITLKLAEIKLIKKRKNATAVEGQLGSNEWQDPGRARTVDS